MNRREDLIETIRSLREELAPVRAELLELNSIVTSSDSELSIQRRVKQFTDSFEAIIPEASLTGAQRFQRRLAVVQRLVRPIVKFMAGFVMRTGVSWDEVRSYALEAPDLVMESRAVVDRTVTAKTFAGLIKTEALQSLVKHHLSPAEITAIEISMSNPK